MKIATATSLIVAFACPLATHASIPFVVSNKSNHAKQSALKLRGGDLGPISGKALATTFGVIAITDVLAGAIKPVEAWEQFGITIEPGSKGEHYLGHGMASSAASLATTSLLALYGKTSAEEAIGYGFLTRCVFMTEALLTNRYKDLGVPTVPHVIIYLILFGTAFALLSGNSDSNSLAKVVSILLAGHGGLLFLNPRIDGENGVSIVQS